jgi:hypothetical protein
MLLVAELLKADRSYRVGVVLVQLLDITQM